MAGWLATNYLTETERFDAAMQQRFRDILRASLRRDEPNPFVIFVLGERGDEEVLADLEAFKPRSVEARALERWVTGAAWKIRIRRSPSELVAFLERGQTEVPAEWVVRCGLENAVPKEDLRRGLLGYYANCPEVTLEHNRHSYGLDQLVIEHGLLEPSELPPRPWEEQERKWRR